MTPEPETFAWYVGELVSRLGAHDPGALRRMRAVAGLRQARLGLQDETLTVRFDAGGTLVIGTGDAPDGAGSTTHRTVAGILTGDIDLTDAIVDGDIDIRGTIDAVLAMLAVIEILLDCAGRSPELRELADRYLREHPGPADPSGGRRRTRLLPLGAEPIDLAKTARPDSGLDL